MTETTATKRWLIVVAACVAAAAVAFAIGRFTAFGTSAAAPNEADAGFARDMQVHHAQAVDMAMVAYRASDDIEVRTLAYDIATGQSAQKGEMFDWLVQWGLPQRGAGLMSWMAEDHSHPGEMSDKTLVSEEDLLAAMGMATDAEIAALREATGTEADCQFLTLMIRHHEGAIGMVDAVLEHGSQPRVLEVASGMKETQSAEIDAMHSMLGRLDCTPSGH